MMARCSNKESMPCNNSGLTRKKETKKWQPKLQGNSTGTIWYFYQINMDSKLSKPKFFLEATEKSLADSIPRKFIIYPWIIFRKWNKKIYITQYINITVESERESKWAKINSLLLLDGICWADTLETNSRDTNGTYSISRDRGCKFNNKSWSNPSTNPMIFE